MNIIGYYFSSLLNMLAFTNNDNDNINTESTKEEEESEDKEEESEDKEEESEDKESPNKNEESEETFSFIDVFDKEKEEFNHMVHEIFLTNF